MDGFMFLELASTQGVPSPWSPLGEHQPLTHTTTESLNHRLSSYTSKVGTQVGVPSMWCKLRGRKTFFFFFFPLFIEQMKRPL